MSLDFILTNCRQTNGAPSISGVHIVMYENCVDLEANCIESASVVNICMRNGTHNITATNLTIGQVYYVVVDGCNGDICDVEIDVTGPCSGVAGGGTVATYSDSDITGLRSVCLGDTEVYDLVPSTGSDLDANGLLDGADMYRITVGSIIGQGQPDPGNYLLEQIDGSDLLSYTFNNAGDYEVCYDAASVCDDFPMAPSPECFTVSVSSGLFFTSTPPAAVTMDCSDPPSHPSLDYANDQGPLGQVFPRLLGGFDICGTTYSVVWDTVDACGNTLSHTQTVTITPPNPIEFINPPTDETISCDDPTDHLRRLNYTNNEAGPCLFEGTVFPTVISGMDDPCGGQYAIQWDTIDACGFNISHTQTITITPPAQAQFINPPADQTVDCNDTTDFVVPLNYSNEENGRCLFEGTVFPTVISGIDDSCGSQYVIVWDTLDNCGNSISYTQMVTRLQGGNDITFINPPSDMTVDCDDTSSYLTPLPYWDGTMVLGSTSPTVSGNRDVCGGTLIVEWSQDLSNGSLISHAITVTVRPAEPILWIDAPDNTSVNCGSGDMALAPLSYSNQDDVGCLFEGQVTPTIITGSLDSCGSVAVLQWQATDPCGNTIQHTQAVTITTTVSTTQDLPDELVIWPNPAASVLHWSISDPTARLSIYSLQGKQVITATTHRHIDVSTLPDGAYIAIIAQAEKHTKQLILIMN